MIKEIIDKFGEFSDSWVSDIKYWKKFNNDCFEKVIELTISCANKMNSNEYEQINIIFSDVLEFKFFEGDKADNFTTGDVLVKENDNTIIFDFFPIDHFDYLEENPTSDFKIKCKKVDYKFIRSING